MTVKAGKRYQGGLSQLRLVSVTSHLSTALPSEKRLKTISGHVARSPVDAWVRILPAKRGYIKVEPRGFEPLTSGVLRRHYRGELR